MSNHTTVPWKMAGKSQSDSHYNVVGTKLGGKFKIARCPFVPGWIEDEAEAEANAKLIAAAPAMLESLKYCKKVFETITIMNMKPFLEVVNKTIDMAIQLDNQK